MNQHPVKPSRTERRKQADRSEAMRDRLMSAAVDSLVELGYARTTAVEVCRRAGVTRGALFHHFEGLPDLLAQAMEAQFQQVLQPFDDESVQQTLEEWLRRFWATIDTPKFKAVLELWLAARNDPTVTDELQAAMSRVGTLFAPINHPTLKKRLALDDEALSFFHAATEAMFGLVLGRATTPNNQPLPHQNRVTDWLFSQAKQFDTV